MVCLLSAIGNTYTAIIYILSTLAVVFITLPVHEFAHGFVATKLGDPTPRYQGRLTLNPFAHIDYIGALCMVLLGVGWAKPVQVNARYFKNPKVGMALTAAAGPIANLIVALISSFFSTLIYYYGNGIAFLSFLNSFLYYIAYMNVYLAVFNLIPIPPLDGSRLLSVFLPYKYYYKLMRYERYSFIILMVLIFALSRTGFNPLTMLTSIILRGIQTIAEVPFSVLAYILLR